MEKPRSDTGGWIPVLGNKRKLDAKVGYENLNRGEKEDAQWVTLFIHNLPEDTSHAWLKKFFTKFVSANVAISKANGLWMEDRKLFVKIASFDQNDKGRNVRLNKGPSKVVTRLESFRKDPGLIGNSNIPIAESSKSRELVGGNFSYAQMLKGNNQGGLESGVKSVSLKLKPTGMPLNVWNLDSFRKIGEKWGAFMKVDDSTLHCLSFTNGRVLVATEIMSTIDDSIQLDIDGFLYKVKVREEPLAFGVEARSRSGQNTSVDKEVSDVSKSDACFSNCERSPMESQVSETKGSFFDVELNVVQESGTHGENSLASGEADSRLIGADSSPKVVKSVQPTGWLMCFSVS
ncbi:hypothetical protein RHMOL_Rhmol02G0051900 [Rhododendron molle]|uniref:Uncharacterized protein n=1 Tax=Rhododendron molle TaxID=49168 RepID=A0ACC0PNG9_RHOML|nr:hypothetical protein RHMOL_Rhmol02G0051900 [Rhododendron molle]